MLAQRTEEAGAIRLVAEAIDHNGLGRPPGSRALLLALVGRGGRIGGRSERDLRAVGAPYRRAGPQPQRRELLGLAAVRREEPHLCRPIFRTEERDRRAIRRPCG